MGSDPIYFLRCRPAAMARARFASSISPHFNGPIGPSRGYAMKWPCAPGSGVNMACQHLPENKGPCREKGPGPLKCLNENKGSRTLCLALFSVDSLFRGIMNKGSFENKGSWTLCLAWTLCFRQLKGPG